MASISRDKSGNRTIQVVCADGKRRSLRLGKMPKKVAETIKGYVEALNAAAVAHTAWDRETASWVGDLDNVLYDKIAAIGLVPKRIAVEHFALAAFLDGYIAKQTDKKPSTIVCLSQCRNDLVAYFSAERDLNTITEGDAEDWRHWLRQKRVSHPGRKKSGQSRASKASHRDRNKTKQPPKQLQENTIRRRCGRARQLFQAAVRHRLIDRNPFAELKGVSVTANKSREHFITRDIAGAVLDACPDAQWKLLFALSRYGGLRCPSETLGLRWGDVDFDRGRVVVRSPKTEHHEGREFRVLPLFPELRPYLQAALDELLSDFDPKAQRLSEQPVITRYRDVNANLRTQLLRILAKAGVEPWPKLFQNLRASRATELASEHPGHVAAAWLGHSTEIAQRHYWQVTDADFDRATGLGEAVQNPVQSAAGTTSTESSANMPIVLFTAGYDPVPNVTRYPVAEAGVEPARGLPLNGF